MARIFSGIQPSGALHLGNYIGALRQWLELQRDHQALFCIVDYHALTVRQDPQTLTENIYSLAALYLAVGINPKRVVLFQQSAVSAHTELAWILNTLCGMGELERMTQYKDKLKQLKRSQQNVGLFTYPVLMAADILLYQTNLVPVGEDQKQHLELTRDLAERFNQRYGETFTLPESLQPPIGARIMSLDDPTIKMSKSGGSEWSYIALTDKPEVVRKKIKRAVTDSGTTVAAGADKPALSNLLTIYSALTGQTVAQLEKLYAGQGYGKFKNDLAEVVVEWLKPIQQKYYSYLVDVAAVQHILESGAEQARVLAESTLADVKTKIGVSVKA